jgi:hypothetical protein
MKAWKKILSKDWWLATYIGQGGVLSWLRHSLKKEVLVVWSMGL